MLRVVVLSVAALAANAVPAAASASSSSGPAPSALERLDRAYLEGRIDAPTHALLGFRLARAPETLPADLRPAPGETIRCGTLLAKRALAMAKLGAFSPEQHEEWMQLGTVRPTLPDFTVVDDGAGNFIATIHYDAAAVDEAALEGFVRTAWNAQVGTMGWRAPVLDDGTGGDTDLDLYFDPAQTGAVTVPLPGQEGPETWDDIATYIVIESTVATPETFIAHELNHAIQFAYDYQDADLIYEATATWMEDKVFDAADEYAFYVEDFQDNPQLTLSYATYDDPPFYMYGAALFLHFLADNYDGGGTALVESVWEGMKDAGSDWYDGMETALGAEGTDLAGAYAEFAGYRFLTGTLDDGSIEEGDVVAPVVTEQTYASLSDVGNGTSANPPHGLGANYLRVDVADAVEGDALKLTITSTDAGPWAITTVARPQSGSADVTVHEGTEAKIGGLAGYQVVGFAITHLGGVADGPHADGDPDPATHAFSWTLERVDDEEPVGCGCRIPERTRPFSAASVLGALLAGTAIVLARRRAG